MQELQWNKSEQIIRKFDNENQDFHIYISNQAKVKYCAVIAQSQISFTFDISDKDSEAECYFLIPAKANQDTTLNIQTNLESSNTKILIHIIALAADNASITLNGNLHIKQWISKVEARLFEENLLLGKSKYISLVPWLKVDSPDVVASHWAKVQRISPEILFYMESRGLSEGKTIWMLINSYSQQIAEKLKLNNQEKSDFYSMIN